MSTSGHQHSPERLEKGGKFPHKNGAKEIYMNTTEDGLPDIHLMEVNPTKRSIQLKILRDIFWNRRDVNLRTAVCLPGQSGWDIEYLLKVGEGHPRVSDLERIIGIEKEPSIAEQLRKRYRDVPQVEIFQGTVGEFFYDANVAADLIYLDYCSALTLGRIQEIELMFRNKVLAERGRLIVAFSNAHEPVSAQLAQRRLFEDMDRHWKSGESWASMDPDRRRCVAFNALLARQRVWSSTGNRGHNHINQYAGTVPINRWYRYPSVGGSMLTGACMMWKYGTSVNVKATNLKDQRDRWLARDHWRIQDVKKPKTIGPLTTSEKGSGKTLAKRLALKKIVDFYREHGHPPARHRVGVKDITRLEWNALLRELGLCPNREATLDDIKRELRRIHERVGRVRREHLRAAKFLNNNLRIITRDAVVKKYGATTKHFGTLLDEMGIPHDLRPAAEVQQHLDIRTWVRHLESGRPRNEVGRLYFRMHYRDLVKYENAAAELRRLNRKYGTLPDR
jgi:hypothetical protein